MGAQVEVMFAHALHVSLGQDSPETLQDSTITGLRLPPLAVVHWLGWTSHDANFRSQRTHSTSRASQPLKTSPGKDVTSLPAKNLIHGLTTAGVTAVEELAFAVLSCVLPHQGKARDRTRSRVIPLTLD